MLIRQQIIVGPECHNSTSGGQSDVYTQEAASYDNHTQMQDPLYQEHTDHLS